MSKRYRAVSPFACCFSLINYRPGDEIQDETLRPTKDSKDRAADLLKAGLIEEFKPDAAAAEAAAPAKTDDGGAAAQRKAVAA